MIVHDMHELSMATSVLDTIADIAEKEGAIKITEITIEIGELLFLNPEQFQFCLELVMENTLAEGAQLHLSVTPSKLRCKSCDTEFRWNRSPDDHFIFPTIQCTCGSKDMEIIEGRELNIVSIRIEKPD
jgi:hydrogenase nickel incorporation protein HypA/HybF